MKMEDLKLVYFAYLHTCHGIIFWVNAPDNKIVIRIQKKTVRIMAGAKRSLSCRKIFRKFTFVPLTSKYLLSILSLVWSVVIKRVIQIQLLRGYYCIPWTCSLFWYSILPIGEFHATEYCSCKAEPFLNLIKDVDKMWTIKMLKTKKL